MLSYFQDKREKYMSDFFTTFVDLDWLYSVEFVSNTIIEKFNGSSGSDQNLRVKS